MGLTADSADPRQQRVRFVDRLAKFVISLGGVGVLAAVVAIFVFVAWEALPLLGGASFDDGATQPAPADGGSPVRAILSDEYREVVATVHADGRMAYRRADGEPSGSDARLVEDGAEIRAAVTIRSPQTVLGVTDDGRLITASFRPEIRFDDAGIRHVTAGAEVFDPAEVREDGGTLDHVAGKVFDDDRLVAAVAGPGYTALVRMTLGGMRARIAELPGADGDTVTALAVASFGDQFRVFAGTAGGELLRWDITWTSEPKLFERVHVSDVAVTALAVLLGEEAIVTGDANGALAAWFGVRRNTEEPVWNLVRVHELPPLSGPVTRLEPAPRSRAFLAADAEGRGGLFHTTTERRLGDLPPDVGALAAATFTPKSDGVYLAGEDGSVASYDLSMPHPEATPAALFLPVWYEGAIEPLHKWQSTGGESDFEPKLSLTTLVFGSLKGVLYALLFSIPIAIAAAVYTSLFLPARLRAIVKPTIEIMAALPSVVIGLLAALWLSPLVETHLGKAFALFPAFLVAFGLLVLFWCLLPRTTRQRLAPGERMLVLSLPSVILMLVLAHFMGPAMEDLFWAGDVKAWMRDTLGLRYDPRNALVVGFAMGFAVIPVMFTIAEDAIGNVPRSLWAASEALGASRWQTTWRVVLPASAPGLFAALMLGFGRAIGETMIVLMATGNTPIMDLSPFNGMRTISACIAVEIPEAPHGGTLYRVLFLAGALLFAFTFACNTIAEVVGHRLRKKYGRF